MDNKKVKDWLKALNNASYNKALVLSAILEDCSYDELEQIYSKSSGLFKGLLSLSFLKRTSYRQLFSNSVKPRRDFKEFVGVIAYIIKKNSALINKYIVLKKQIERAILNGDYAKARRLIEMVNSQVSYSYWAATTLIKIARLEKGLNECTDLYNLFCSQNDTIVQRLYYGAYRSSSLDFIAEDLKRMLVPYGKEYSEFVNDFLISHCMPYWDFKEGDWICVDSNSSIIDLYNIFLTCLPNMSEETRTESSVQYYLNIINSCVNDLYLSKICYLYGITDRAVTNKERDSIIEAYLDYDYPKVIETAEEYLSKEIDDFEIQTYYLKSLYFQGGTVSQPGKDSSLIERIKFYYFSIISHSEGQVTNKRRLLNLCRSQYNLQGIRHLYTYIEGIDSFDIYNLYKTVWKFSSYNTPLDVSFFASNNARKEYICRIVQEGGFWDRLFIHNQSSFSKELFELSLASERGDNVFNYLVSEWDKGGIAFYLKDAVATFIYQQYINRGQFKDGICFYVDNKIADKALSIGIQENELLIKLYENKALADIIPLELSIFAEMTGADADTVYFIYKRYLKHCNVAKASDITINGDVKQKYFLEYVAVPKVLTLHVLRFKSISQVMEERSSICTNLYERFQDKYINDEISAICRDIKIRELNKQVNESKIYVDVQSIKDHDAEEAKTLYEMFSTASSQVAFQDILKGEIIARLATHGIQTTILEVDEQGGIKVSESPVEMVNYRKDVLSQLFFVVRDQFLFNPKYGLDNYLSTRIRHGTLINQLRNHFEIRNLVTNTTDGAYSINEYWISNQFKLKNNDALRCVQLFENFSKGIDDIITEIKDSFIQVRTEGNRTKDKGCFDFDKRFFANDIDSLLLKSNINTFDSCFSAIVECLWKRTEMCLETMHERLNEAQTKMIGLLRALQIDIVDVVGESQMKINDFKDAISFCQNGIQNDFQIVKKWFKRSDYVDFDFTIGQVIDTSIDFIRRNNRYMPNPQVIDASKSTLQGRYFGPLYDMFHDVLNNALDYEKKFRLKRQWTIDVKESDGFMSILVSNPIRKEDVESLKQKVLEINESLDETLYKGKSRNEGNSGCSKIFNAVTYHLGSSKNEYMNEIDDNNNRFIAKMVIELKPITK